MNKPLSKTAIIALALCLSSVFAPSAWTDCAMNRTSCIGFAEPGSPGYEACERDYEVCMQSKAEQEEDVCKFVRKSCTSTCATVNFDDDNAEQTCRENCDTDFSACIGAAQKWIIVR